MNAHNVFFFEDMHTVTGKETRFVDLPWPALRQLPSEDIARLADLVVWSPIADGAMFQGPGVEAPGVFFLRSGQVSVSGRLANGLFGEPVCAGSGMTLGESTWPKVATPAQRIWANKGVEGWLLPKDRIPAARRALPALGHALETLGILRRGLAGLVGTAKQLPGLHGAAFPVLAGIVMAGEVLKFRKGEAVLRAHRAEAPAPTEGLYLLISGSVRATTLGSDQYSILTNGSAFGGMTHGGLAFEPADVVALHDSVVLRLPIELLRAALWASPNLRHAALGAPALEERLQNIVEVLLFVGDEGFAMRQMVDLLAQTAVKDFRDRVAVVRLLPAGSERRALTRGEGGIWRGTFPLEPDHPLDKPTIAEWRKPGNLEYIFLDGSGVSQRQLTLVRRYLTRVVVCSSEPWKDAPFPLAPGRVNWCQQVGSGRVVSDPPFAPTAIRVRFNMEKVGKARRLSDLGPDDRERFSRWIRGITERRVGLALGGGGSWGFAHTTLIKAIRAADIPIDMVSGSSFGSMCGAFWCAGDSDFRALQEFAPQAQGATRLAFFSSLFLQRRVDAALRKLAGSTKDLLLEDLEVPLFPVATNISTGSEAVIGVGTVGFGVRCSSSFPGLITPTTGRGFRYVDGGIVRNVPTTPLANQGANLLIASNIVASPAYQVAPKPLFGGAVGRVLHEFNPVGRTLDTMRSALILMHAAGEATAAEADVQFASEPIDASPILLTGGARIAELAEDDVAAVMPLIQMRWDALKARDP